MTAWIYSQSQFRYQKLEWKLLMLLPISDASGDLANQLDNPITTIDVEIESERVEETSDQMLNLPVCRGWQSGHRRSRRPDG